MEVFLFTLPFPIDYFLKYIKMWYNLRWTIVQDVCNSGGASRLSSRVHHGTERSVPAPIIRKKIIITNNYDREPKVTKLNLYNIPVWVIFRSSKEEENVFFFLALFNCNTRSNKSYFHPAIYGNKYATAVNIILWRICNVCWLLDGTKVGHLLLMIVWNRLRVKYRLSYYPPNVCRTRYYRVRKHMCTLLTRRFGN